MVKGFKNKKYTPEEEIFLKENYSKLGNKNCAEILNRSAQALNKKAKKMGLSIAWQYTYTCQQGYLIDCHVRSNRKLVHRMIMEKHLNRPLSSDEVVHHIDGNKQNNDISNLKLMTRAEHMNHHRKEIKAGMI